MQDGKRPPFSVHLRPADLDEPSTCVEGASDRILLININPRDPATRENRVEERAPDSAALRIRIDEEHLENAVLERDEADKTAPELGDPQV